MLAMTTQRNLGVDTLVLNGAGSWSQQIIQQVQGQATQVIQEQKWLLKEEMKKPKMLLNDKKVAEAIIYIFENHDMLKIYNKNLVYHLLKERTGLQTKEITYSLSRFKSFYRFFKQDFLKSKD